MQQLVVIGSGLAGLSATVEAVRAAQDNGQDLQVTVVEKMPNLGGNSMKASSGINAVNPPVGDSTELYENDTMKSGGGLSKAELVSRLVDSSEHAIHFLESLGIELDKISRLGGHSVPRSRSNSVGPNVGFAIMRAAIAKVQAMANVRIITNAKVTRVAHGEDGWAVECTVNRDGVTERQILSANALIFATGGFAANKTMLQDYDALAAAFATTNGPWATGDGILLGKELGASLIHMDQVQIHPTGFIDPADPTAGTKFLAAERLRGAGGVLINMDGRRFVDELQRRDIVTGEMMKQREHSAWLVLGQDAAAEFGQSAMDFYCFKKLMAKFVSLEEAARHMSVTAEVVRAELDACDAAAAAGQQDLLGRSSFAARFDGGEGGVFVGRVTPVVHYCMGGLAIDDSARVLGQDGRPIEGVFAAGEVSGGLHGRNRLGGNSLLECVVFGRQAGREAVALMAQLEAAELAPKRAELALQGAAL